MPAPGGATSTAQLAAASAAFNRGSTKAIGTSVLNVRMTFRIIIRANG